MVEPQIVAGPATWKGPDVEGDSSWRFELNGAHRAELINALAAVENHRLSDIGRANFVLPELGPVFDGFVDDLCNGRGFVLIRGVPIEGLTEPAIERMYWGIGQHLGIPIPQNDAGEYLVHIRDEGLDFADPTVRGYRTSAPLNYHSDSTDVVGLLCVRPAKEGGVSTVVSAAAVFNEALRRRPDLVDVLMQPWWWDRRKKDLTSSFFTCRIFGIDDDQLFSYYGRSHLESAVRSPDVPDMTDAQVAALDLLDSIANDPAFVLNMSFRPGDIQFLNNYKVWHSRTAFEDYAEPERKRDLYRLWLTVRRDLQLPADFAAGGITNRSVAFQ